MGTCEPGPRRHARHGPRVRRPAASDLEPTLPVLLGNAVSVNQVVVSHLDGVGAVARHLPAGDHLVGFTWHPRATATATSTCSWSTANRRALRATSLATTGVRRATSPTARSTRRTARPVRRSPCAVQLLTRDAGQPVAGTALPFVVRPHDRDGRGAVDLAGQPGTVRRSGQPVDPEMTRGNGSGGTGDEPVRAPNVSRRGLHAGLYVVALLLGCRRLRWRALPQQEHQDRQHASAEQARYGDVLGAARTEIEAFVNTTTPTPRRASTPSRPVPPATSSSTTPARRTW